MVAVVKELPGLELSIESFFFGKWVIEKEYPCIPGKLLHMPKLRSHDTKKAKKNTENEVPPGENHSTVHDVADKRLGTRRKAKKSEKVSGKTETVYPVVLSTNVPLEYVTQCMKKTDVFEIATADRETKGRSRKRKIEKSKTIESHEETAGEGLSSTLALRKSQRIQNRKNNNHKKDEPSAQHVDGKLTKTARVCLKDISNGIKKPISREESRLRESIQCKEKEPNKDGQGKAVRNNDRFSKEVGEPIKKSRCRPRYGEVNYSDIEKNDNAARKKTEASKDGPFRNPARKAKTKINYRYQMDDSFKNSHENTVDSSHNETWVEPALKKKKIDVKKFEIDKENQSVNNNNNDAPKRQNKTSDQKEIQDENIKQVTNYTANTRKTKKTRTEESKKLKTSDEVADKTYSQKKRKENFKPDDNVNARETKVTSKSRTEKAKKTKTDKVAATTSNQGKQKETLKPEDCVITAQQGTLRYLKQRERLLEARSKEAEVEDDFFSNNFVLKGKKNMLNQLLAPSSHDDSLTIRTPKSKVTGDSDCAITPRTTLLGKFGTVTPSSVAVTPCSSSPLPSKSKGRNAALQVMYHQMKGANKRPRGIRKNHKDNFLLSDSMLKKIQDPELLELPGFSEASASDSSHDEYFNQSDII